MKIKILDKLKVSLFDLIKIKNTSQTNKDDGNKSINFYSLSPKDNIDSEETKVYFNALKWALENRKTENIRNIAITGPYGSGKSSVINTFIKKNADHNDWKFLTISLATFSDYQSRNDKPSVEKPKSDITKTDNETDLQRLIELSILQQIVYREKDLKLPDSRMRKIKKRSWKRLILQGFCLFVFILLLINLFFKYKYNIDFIPSVLLQKWSGRRKFLTQNSMMR